MGDVPSEGYTLFDGLFEVSVLDGLARTQRSASFTIQFRVDEPGHFTKPFIEDAGATWGGPYRLQHGDQVSLAAGLYFVARNDGGPSGIRISDSGYQSRHQTKWSPNRPVLSCAVSGFPGCSRMAGGGSDWTGAAANGGRRATIISRAVWRSWACCS
jgi:hypothetical protein